jgi:hypothetical protein
MTESKDSLNAFLPSLEAFCTKFLVVGQKPVSPAEGAKFPQRFEQLKAELFEHLLLFDKVTVKVYGENVPLVVLLRLFGQRAAPSG